MTKTWLITGSSRGLGREIAHAALAAGHNVVATARRPEQLDELVRKYGDSARAVGLDVADPAAAAAAVDTAVRAFGGLDVVVNNAGYADSAPIEEMSLADFRAQIETNLFGVVNLTKAALPILHRQRSGHFLQFSSIGGRGVGSAGMGAYQAAKFAVEGFSQVLDHEVKPLGIKVTIIEPGAFRTEWGGASMRRISVGADYEQTVGRMNSWRESTVDKWPGDPARAAQTILELVQLDEPPLRLLLGSDALRLAAEASDSRAAEADRWAELSRSTDFPA